MMIQFFEDESREEEHMNQEHSLITEVTKTETAEMNAGVTKRAYTPPASVQLSGAKDEEYGAAIAAVAVWVIGIGPAWIW